jgi:hypothetical protein
VNKFRFTSIVPRADDALMKARDIMTDRDGRAAPAHIGRAVEMGKIGRAGRRGFLLGAGAGAAAAVAAMEGVARVHPIPAAAAKAVPKPPQGYRASPHVVKYYRTTET